MSTPYDKAKPGGNSSFGNTQRPPDIQGDEPENQAEPHDPARPPGQARPDPRPAVDRDKPV